MRSGPRPKVDNGRTVRIGREYQRDARSKEAEVNRTRAVLVVLSVVGTTSLSGTPALGVVGQPGTRADGGSLRAPTEGIVALRERAINTLVELSSDSNPQVRANAIEGLSAAPGRLESVVALGVLDPNVGVRTVSFMVAGRHKVESVEGVARTCATEESPYVQAAALFALKRLGADPDLTPLGTMLMSAEEPRVRAHAAFVLGEIGEESALSMLRHAAARPMPRASESAVSLMRLQIAEAMVKLGDDSQIHTLHAALYPSRPEDLESAALAAQILGEVDAQRSVPDLMNLAVAKDEQGNPMPAEVRLAAARSVAKLGRRDGNFIAIEYASSQNPVIRAQVASVFAETLGRDELGELEAMLEDPDALVRVSAAASLLRAVERLSGR